MVELRDMLLLLQYSDDPVERQRARLHVEDKLRRYRRDVRHYRRMAFELRAA